MHQLKTGGGPPIMINDDEEDMHEKVRSIVPTIDFTLQNRWDSTSEIEGNIFFFYLIFLLFTSIFFINFKKYDDLGNMKDTQDIFEEQEIGNNKDFDKYKRENYNENSNENDHVSCYLAADLNANTGLSKI